MAKIALPKLPLARIGVIALQALAIGGGVALGAALKAKAPADAGAATGEQHDAGGDSHAPPSAKAENADVHKPDKKKADKKKESGHNKKEKGGDSHGGSKGGGHGEGEEGGNGYMKFSRQFVVPVVHRTGVSSLVVIDVSIEMPAGAAEAAYQREPKLRDAVLRALLELSNRGAFENDFLQASNLDAVRAELLLAARGVVGEDAQDILLLSITRQDV